jgi:hypothetical protein
MGGVLARLAPPGVPGHVGQDFPDNPVEDEVEQLVLVPDVPVEGCRPGVQLLAEAAHRQRFQPLFVHDPERRLDDLATRQGHPGRALACRRARPREEVGAGCCGSRLIAVGALRIGHLRRLSYRTMYV